MNVLRLPRLATLLLALCVAGCGSLDLSSEGRPDRVLTGTVNVGASLPAGAELVVRLVAAPVGNDGVRPVASDLPVMARPTGPAAERVLGQYTQTLPTATSEPLPFRIEYVAEDAVLRRGLNVDVRVSVGGKMRYRTVNGHVVTLASSPYKQDVSVQPVNP